MVFTAGRQPENREKGSLDIVDVYRYYGKKAVLDGVTMKAVPGQITGLLGPNGAGKTSCFDVVTGISLPDRGRVLLDGRDITYMPTHKRAAAGLSYLPQECSVFRGLSVADNIAVALESLRLPQHLMQERLNTLLMEFGLTSVKDNLVMAVSGGQRRRVEIARALAGNPEFILMDEPFVGVDPLVLDDLRRILIRLRNRGIGIVITDHNVWEVLQIVDFSYVIYDGKIIASGTPANMVQDKFVQKIYLGERFSA